MNASLRNPFLYVACQHGAEKVLKRAFCEPLGTFRLAYSGKGFLTFKTPFALPAWSKALPIHPLVRSRGLVLGRVDGNESGPMVDKILNDFQGLDWQVIHVWQRDIAQPGWNGFEPGQSQLAISIAEMIRLGLRRRGDPRLVLANGLESEPSPSKDSIVSHVELVATSSELRHPAPVWEPQVGTSTAISGSEERVPPLEPVTRPRVDQSERTPSAPKIASDRPRRILEILIDEPQRWWIASKTAQLAFDFWPGGVPELYQPEEVISRAYFKIAEAFAWSGLKVRPGERVVEIGSAPGGACQWLLDAGAKVTGLDPADMDEGLLAHPNFTHWRSRSLQVKRRAFRDFRMLICDANVTPNYTLDTVEAIVTYPTSRFRALILTMKMPDWEHALAIEEHLQRVRSWGYEHVDARQLAHNRREYCIVAKGRIRVPLGSGPTTLTESTVPESIPPIPTPIIPALNPSAVAEEETDSVEHEPSNQALAADLDSDSVLPEF